MSAVEKLAREILDTRRLALGHATAPQLGNTSLDGGRIDFRDWDGNLVGGIGIGEDGGIVVDYDYGPKPGSPSRPTVTADSGMFRVEWDGTFVPDNGDGSQDGQGLAPTSDLDRVEVHASMDENFVPDRVLSFAGAFSSLDGGSFMFGPLPEAGTYYFRLVARSKAGKFSAPSERVEQELAIASMDLAVTDAWLTGEAAQTTADGKNSIWRGPDEPPVDPDAPFKDGDIWFEMTPDGKSIPNIWDETTGAWVGNDDYRQSEIERVQQELRQDLDAVITDGSGTKNFYRGTMPTDEESSEGDLWFDSSDSNKPYIYQDGQWVTVQSTFASPGAGEILASRNSEGFFDKAVTSTPDFTLDPERQSRFVYSGSASGTVSVIVPVLGAADPSDLSMVFDGTEASKVGLGLLANLALYANSPGGTPNFESVFLVDLPSSGQVVPTTSVLPVSAGSGGLTGATHHATEVDDNTATLLEIYLQRGLASRVAFGIRVTLPAAAGAWVEVMDLSVSQTLGEDGISDNAITTPKIATGAITAESGIIGSINAGTITVGEMEGARIKAGTVDADTVLVESSIGSTLIKDGAILTEHIKVGAITAESGIIGSIDANVITVGKIMGNQLDADAINGKTITGATVRTASSGSRVELTKNGLKQYNSLGATIVDMTSGSFALEGGTITGAEVRTSASGARVEMDSMGLHLFDKDSRRTFFANASDGSVTMIGDIRTASLGARVEIVKSQNMWGTTGSGIRFYTQDDETDGALNISTEKAPFSGSISTVEAFGSWLSMNSFGTASLWGGSRATFNVDDGNAKVIADGNELTLEAGGADFNLRSDGSGPQVYSKAIYNRKYTTSSANVYITGYGTLGLGSSARRFKADEKAIAVDTYEDALLSVDYKSWYDKEELRLYHEYLEFREQRQIEPVPARLGEAPQQHPDRVVGAIAEDFVDAGLPELVQFDEYGRTQGINYDRIGVALIPIIRGLRDRIDSLEAQLAAT